MSPLRLLGDERDLLQRWRHAVDRDATLLTPARALSLTDCAGLCLFDLGPRGDADDSALLMLLRSWPSCLFVALTARPQAAEGIKLLGAGVRGYCNRLSSDTALAAVVAAVESGEIWAGRQVTDHLLAQAVRPAGPDPQQATVAPLTSATLARLTSREIEIAGLVADGRSNKAIAIDLGITERTVKAHLNAVFRKTGLRNRVQLALALTQSPSIKGHRIVV